MIYPNNFEHKLGFDEIRRLLKERCLSTLGKEKVDEIAFSTDVVQVNEWLTQVREFRRLQAEKDDFPMQYFFDVREAVSRIRLEGTHLEEDEVWDLRRSLETIANIVRYLNRTSDDEDAEREGFEPEYPYPALHRLTRISLPRPAQTDGGCDDLPSHDPPHRLHPRQVRKNQGFRLDDAGRHPT